MDNMLISITAVFFVSDFFLLLMNLSGGPHDYALLGSALSLVSVLQSIVLECSHVWSLLIHSFPS